MPFGKCQETNPGTDVSGTLATSEYIVRHCINEDTVYMPDYVTDESGRVKEIRYDKIYMK